MTDIPEKVATGLMDVPLAPEVFVFAASGFFVLNGNIAITFETARSDYSTNPPGVNRVVVGRVVMPIAGAQNLVVGLSDFLKSRGMDASAAIVGEATRQ